MCICVYSTERDSSKAKRLRTSGIFQEQGAKSSCNGCRDDISESGGDMAFLARR
jgi:hypothetical protein